MYSAILNVTFDCHDPKVVAAFWSAVTGYPVEEVASPGNPYWVASPPDQSWPRLVFVAVPERKEGKNRVHLDVVPVAKHQSNELDRLLAFRAPVVHDHRALHPPVRA